MIKKDEVSRVECCCHGSDSRNEQFEAGLWIPKCSRTRAKDVESKRVEVSLYRASRKEELPQIVKSAGFFIFKWDYVFNYLTENTSRLIPWGLGSNHCVLSGSRPLSLLGWECFDFWNELLHSHTRQPHVLTVSLISFPPYQLRASWMWLLLFTSVFFFLKRLPLGRLIILFIVPRKHHQKFPELLSSGKF